MNAVSNPKWWIACRRIHPTLKHLTGHSDCLRGIEENAQSHSYAKYYSTNDEMYKRAIRLVHIVQ